jgi:hypothetical protein
MHNSLTGIKNKIFDITYFLNMTIWKVAVDIFGMVFNKYKFSSTKLTIFLLPLEGRSTNFQNPNGYSYNGNSKCLH